MLGLAKVVIMCGFTPTMESVLLTKLRWNQQFYTPSTNGERSFMPNLTRTNAVCPFCGALNDASTGVLHGQVPRVGDISVCAYCQEAGIFAKDEKGHLIIRKPTAKEWVQIVCDPNVIKAQVMLANLNLSKPKTK